MVENLYCKIYLDCELPKGELIRAIAELVNGKIHLSSIEGCGYEVDIKKNKGFDQNQSHKYPDGFLYYAYYLDVEPRGVESSLYKGYISMLLETFWAKGYRAVAACDFEEDLPRRGGYKWISPS